MLAQSRHNLIWRSPLAVSQCDPILFHVAPAGSGCGLLSIGTKLLCATLCHRPLPANTLLLCTILYCSLLPSHIPLLFATLYCSLLLWTAFCYFSLLLLMIPATWFQLCSINFYPCHYHCHSYYCYYYRYRYHYHHDYHDYHYHFHFHYDYYGCY
jgi:hypothetical protein